MVVRYYFAAAALMAATLGFLLPVPGRGPHLQSQVETVAIAVR
jgi:hypothetical protein